MRSLLYRCCFALCLASSAVAQDHQAWIFTGDPRSDPALGRVTTAGVVTTLLPRAYFYSASPGFAVDLDDRSYVLANPNTRGLLIVDAKGTVIKSVGLPGSGGVQDVVLNAAGDYAVLAWLPGGGGILEVDRRTYAVKTLWFGSQFGTACGFLRDADTGDFIAVKGAPVELLRIAEDGSSISSIATLTIGRTGQIAQDLGTGAFMSLVYPYPPSNWCPLYAVSSRGRVTTISGVPMGDVAAADRATSRHPRVVLATFSGLNFYSHHTQIVTPFARLNGMVTHLQPEASRNVATEARGPGRWVVRFDFPGEARRAYAAALSFSGIRPGLRLPDGRSMLFNPDAISVASLLGHLAPYYLGQVGILDAQGRGQAVLDVSRLPPLRGVSIWIQALTMHPAAPLGLATIADPVQLTL
jgi:hypothetical protein